MRYAFEFRHPSWLVEEVYEALRAKNVSLCVAESERLEVPEVVTADFVYYRLRKPDYTEADVDAFTARSREMLATGRDLYLMFKHEETPEGALKCGEGAEGSGLERIRLPHRCPTKKEPIRMGKVMSWKPRPLASRRATTPGKGA